MQLLTLSEVARLTGISRTSLYRLKNRGQLRGWIAAGPGGRPMLRPEVVTELKRGQLLRQRMDSPWAQQLAPLDQTPQDPAPEAPYGCWPAASWQEWAAMGWADWRPDEPLEDGEHWPHVAGLLSAWLALPQGPLTALHAMSLCLAADEAREAVG